MTSDELKAKLGELADRLVPVAGYLMYVATSNGRVAREPDEHDEGCDCQCCRAFLATQDVTTKLGEIVRAL